MTRAERIEKAASTFLACHDSFVMRQERATAYAMKDAADALRDALVTDAELAPRDEPATLVENHPAILALRNVRMLVRRKWGKGIDEEWAEHLIRFCREGGLTDDILRTPAAPKEEE